MHSFYKSACAPGKRQRLKNKHKVKGNDMRTFPRQQQQQQQKRTNDDFNNGITRFVLKMEQSENIPRIVVCQDRFEFDLLGLIWSFLVLFFMILTRSILLLTQFHCKMNIFHERTQLFKVCEENRHKIGYLCLVQLLPYLAILWLNSQSPSSSSWCLSYNLR